MRPILAHARALSECDLTPKNGASTDRVNSPRYILSNISNAPPAKLSGTEKGTEMTIIRPERLTTFSVAADGSSVSLGVADLDGPPGALVLPTACLKPLMMTLPEVMRPALQLQHDDPSLRLVCRAAGWQVEKSTVPGTFIVTLRTVDGFSCLFRSNGGGSL